MDVFPRPLRAVPNSLGLYIRPGRVDHNFLIDFLAERNDAAIRGVVFDAALDDIQRDLGTEVETRRLESIVDLRAMELATFGGSTEARKSLPWGGVLHTPESLAGPGSTAFINAVVEWLKARHFSAVLAPTHFLDRGALDPWFPVDLDLTAKLRAALDAAGLHDTLIYYPLAVRPEAFFHVVERDRLRHKLTSLPVDGIWLRIHRFGANTGAPAIRRCIRTCTEFHTSGIPLVAEKAGIAGLTLLAFGAVGAVETGITIGDQFDVNRLKKRRREKGGFSAPRVYISELQSFLTRFRARAFFEKRGAKPYFACKDENCCRGGFRDMVLDPRRHFVIARLSEIRTLSETPDTLRPGIYMEQILRRATDSLIQASKAEPALDRARRRLNGWRSGLSNLMLEYPKTFSPTPNGRRILLRRGA